MPRAQTSKITQLVSAFRTMPLEQAEIAFDLVRDEMRGRLQKSAKAKAKAAETATPAPKAKKRKRARTNGSAGPAATAPQAQAEAHDSPADHAAESGD